PVKALVLSAPGREPALPDQHALVPPVGHVPDPGPELEVVVQTFSSAYSDGLVAASRDPHLVERGRVSGALFAWASPHQASLRGFRPVEQEALPADGRYPDPGSGRQFRRVAEQEGLVPWKTSGELQQPAYLGDAEGPRLHL